MTANNPNLREELNSGSGPYRLADGDREICWGDLLGQMVDELANTEAGLNPNVAAQVLQLAAAPSCLLDARATAGAGALNAALTLIVDNDDNRVVNAGEIVWDGPGNTRIRFNATDAYTAVNVKYTVPGSNVSIFERTLGQRD